MNEFNLYPIGQGLFYTGSILNGFYNFVYDCGTESISNNLDISIENYTNELLYQKSDLDMIVISHLHDDHFNGLHKLIKLCNKKNIKIKKIILPYLYNFKNVALTTLINSINENISIIQNENFFQSLYLMNDLYEYGNDYSVEFLSEFTDDNMGDNDYVFTKKNLVIPSAEKSYWNFHLFNKTINYTKCKLLNDRIEKLLKFNNETDLVKYILKFADDGIKEIKKVYEKIITKDLNVTSTILLHYPIYNNTSTYLIDYEYFDVINCNRKISFPCYNLCHNFKFNYSSTNMTLLTGDAKFVKKMRDYIENLIKDNDCILQVPHHGSYQNWNLINQSNINFTEYIIPFGLGNSYNHPSGKTIEEIVGKVNNVNCIYEVNQLKGLCYYII